MIAQETNAIPDQKEEKKRRGGALLHCSNKALDEIGDGAEQFVGRRGFLRLLFVVVCSSNKRGPESWVFFFF